MKGKTLKSVGAQSKCPCGSSDVPRQHCEDYPRGVDLHKASSKETSSGYLEVYSDRDYLPAESTFIHLRDSLIFTRARLVAATTSRWCEPAGQILREYETRYDLDKLLEEAQGRRPGTISILAEGDDTPVVVIVVVIVVGLFPKTRHRAPY